LFIFGFLPSESCRSCRLHDYMFVLSTRSRNWCLVLLTFCGNEILSITLMLFFVVQYLITHFSDFQLACLGSFFLHEGVFFLSGLPFIWLERAGWMSKYKIQVCPCSNLLIFVILFYKMEIQCFIFCCFSIQNEYLSWLNCSNIVCFDLKLLFLHMHLAYSLYPVSLVLRTSDGVRQKKKKTNDEVPEDFPFHSVFG